MKVFLSYASEDHRTAEQIFLKLAGAGHDVFFDRSNLAAGESFDLEIQRQIQASDVLVFLLTSGSIQDGRYTRTEIELARAKWRHPEGHILVVQLQSVADELVPPYLQATTYLTPSGDVGAEVLFAVQRLAGVEVRSRGSHLKETGSRRQISHTVTYRGSRIRAVANRPVTTRFRLFVDAELIAEASRPVSTDVVCGIQTWIGRKPRWSIEGTTSIGGRDCNIRAVHVTTFSDQHIEIYVNDLLLGTSATSDKETA